MMSNLVNEQFWCPDCQQWHDSYHRGCAVNGRVQVDLHSGHQHCSGCGHAWEGEKTGLYCNDRQVSNAEYQDTAVEVAEAEGYLVTDGEQVYLITAAQMVEEVTRYFTNLRGVA